MGITKSLTLRELFFLITLVAVNTTLTYYQLIKFLCQMCYQTIDTGSYVEFLSFSSVLVSTKLKPGCHGDY